MYNGSIGLSYARDGNLGKRERRGKIAGSVGSAENWGVAFLGHQGHKRLCHLTFVGWIAIQRDRNQDLHLRYLQDMFSLSYLRDGKGIGFL